MLITAGVLSNALMHTCCYIISTYSRQNDILSIVSDHELQELAKYWVFFACSFYFAQWPWPFQCDVSMWYSVLHSTLVSSSFCFSAGSTHTRAILTHRASKRICTSQRPRNEIKTDRRMASLNLDLHFSLVAATPSIRRATLLKESIGCARIVRQDWFHFYRLWLLPLERWPPATLFLRQWRI